MSTLSSNYIENRNRLEILLRPGNSFDIVDRHIQIGGRNASLYTIDGFTKDEVLEKILEFLMSVQAQDLKGIPNAKEFCKRYITYIETSLSNDTDTIISAVLSGCLALLIEGYDQAILLETRTYPVRSVQEPGSDQVLRGSHDGFVETLIFNTALIRRRIRDPRLTFQIIPVGTSSKTDVAVCYMDKVVDEKRLNSLIQAMKNIHVKALSLNQESLAEALLHPRWWNPFPKVRYTERPDTAAACLLEGDILVLVDNSPSAMILPTSFFTFTQDVNDFYFPPITGTYLRLIRILVFFFTYLLTPIWLLFLNNPQWVPPSLSFIIIKEPGAVPVFWQLIGIELLIDGLKLASLNTPSALSNSFSIIGALLLGEFAVKSGWVSTEAVLYMAFVALSSFALPSYELGYAIKFFRILALVGVSLFNLWGLIGAVLLFIVTLASTKPLGGGSYLYPLIPFNGKAFLSLIIRMPLKKEDRKQL